MQVPRVEFRVLGPVELWIDGVRVAIGGPGPRGLLAVLLLSRNKAVPAARLVEALWGDGPPATATGRVHAIVSELRRALSVAGLGSGVIRTQLGGYTMDAGVGVLDLDSFLARAGAGREATEGGDH